MGPRIKPDTIVRHAYGIYSPMAMLAGMQLDVFTPLKDGNDRGGAGGGACAVG